MDPETDPEKQIEKDHQFQFCFNSQTNPTVVICNKSMTVLEALNTRDTFRKEENTKNTKKEIVIQRGDGAAVKTDFPCCLIEKDEIVTVTFINKEKNPSLEERPHKNLSLPRKDLVTFNIKTTGRKDVIHLMKNNELEKKADYVCVYALEGEEVETALKHDGRFIDKIFQKLCVLSLESDSKSNKSPQPRYEMSNPVKSLDKKQFQIIAIGDRRPDSQMKQTEVKTESDEASAADSERNDQDQHPISTEQKQTIYNTESTSQSTKWPIIPDSTGILEILRDQFKDLLETLTQRKNLKNKSEIQKFFRAEYDKCVQSFLEVKKVKQLMRLSDSVCQIRVEGSARGTGFLLFDRFILTNAHVIGEFDPFTRKLSKTFTAVFGYEDLEARETKCVPIKEQVAAYYYGKINKDTYLDFALLELDAVDEIRDQSQLLNQYSHGPSPNRGGICIVGHPDGGIMKADPCFIIENPKEAADEHISKNVEFIHVMTQRSFEEKWDIYENQITYDSCFFHGSSGSPVFDEDCCLIGMHTGGYMYPRGKGKRSIMEYAYSMQPILESIITQAKKSERSDILELLSNYTFLNPNLGDNDVDMEENL